MNVCIELIGIGLNRIKLLSSSVVRLKILHFSLHSVYIYSILCQYKARAFYCFIFVNWSKTVGRTNIKTGYDRSPQQRDCFEGLVTP